MKTLLILLLFPLLLTGQDTIHAVNDHITYGDSTYYVGPLIKSVIVQPGFNPEHLREYGDYWRNGYYGSGGSVFRGYAGAEWLRLGWNYQDNPTIVEVDDFPEHPELYDITSHQREDGMLVFYMWDGESWNSIAGVQSVPDVMTWETEGNLTGESEITQYTIGTAIVLLYDEYAEECYADSTARYYYTLCDWDCWEVSCKKGDTIWGSTICPENWEHRPPTFTGFMEWIKTQ